MMDTLLDWLFPYRVFVLLLIGAPALLTWAFGQYVEAVIYNSHRSEAIVPVNRFQERLLQFYGEHRGPLDFFLYCLYLISYALFIICGYLLGDIYGALLGAVIGVGNFLHLRRGLTLKKRVTKKREFDERLERGELKLFG